MPLLAWWFSYGKAPGRQLAGHHFLSACLAMWVRDPRDSNSQTTGKLIY